MTEAKKDKHGKIVSVGNRVMDKDGKIWKIQNIRGLAYLVFPIVGKIDKTILVSKVDFADYEKVA